MGTLVLLYMLYLQRHAIATITWHNINSTIINNTVCTACRLTIANWNVYCGSTGYEIEGLIVFFSYLIACVSPISKSVVCFIDRINVNFQAILICMEWS